jgi:hypothetical protein
MVFIWIYPALYQDGQIGKVPLKGMEDDMRNIFILAMMDLIRKVHDHYVQYLRDEGRSVDTIELVLFEFRAWLYQVMMGAIK